ncbi:hypothetical protein INR49_006833 [Caranx melampygus]|nr:hypothetical protein INR49_006833 [Caranx melampygus]
MDSARLVNPRWAPCLNPGNKGPAEVNVGPEGCPLQTLFMGLFPGDRRRFGRSFVQGSSQVAFPDHSGYHTDVQERTDISDLYDPMTESTQHLQRLPHRAEPDTPAPAVEEEEEV